MMDVSRREFLVSTAVLPAAPYRLAVFQDPPAGIGTDLAFSSASELISALRSGSISSLELTELMFRRIDEINPRVNAIVTLMRDAAIAQAREADAIRARGTSLGPLHGVPVTIKDAFEVKGVRTTAGNPALKDYVPAADSTVVERLRNAGAVLLGMTNVPFMLADYQSYNDVFGQTNNPWDLARTPGGSTGGGAAAVAAGLGYLATGSDIAGSIRIPAHFCGVFGHKPTIGLVPDRGVLPPLPGTTRLPNSLEVCGLLARSAADLGLGLRIIGGPDVNESIAYSWRLPPARHRNLRDYRIGYVLDDVICPVTSDVRRVLVGAIDALRSAGARLTEGWPKRVVPAEEHVNYLLLLSEYVGSARTLARPHQDFLSATRRQLLARSAWREYFQDADVFLLPTAFTPAFAHDHRQPSDVRRIDTPEGPRPYADMTFWTSFATHSGNPATVMPVGQTVSGLPVGLQIIGPFLEDATPIDVAERLEQIIGRSRRPPGY